MNQCVDGLPIRGLNGFADTKFQYILEEDQRIGLRKIGNFRALEKITAKDGVRVYEGFMQGGYLNSPIAMISVKDTSL